ncbi:hypothetical protein NB640_12445 [Oxalobacter vibrioformis]|uniref:Uncharacterized protein n=1 Tax=Oxalobacter vibrioformis TaxID=933080 RepID=A0A9E9LUR0_9BURK|nr:hypothetical protein [Oxalobacter vibrioformis]WAW10010.1 hypothetical protein NB640_12445 [Oxalobacter vibrioformis]
MTKAAPKEKLGELHTALAEVLLAEIKKDETPAAILNVARQFLKDNGIEALAVPTSPLGQLATVLPFPSQEGFEKEPMVVQ